MVGKSPVSWECAHPVSEKRNQAGETGRTGTFTSRYADAGDGDGLCVPQYIAHHSKHGCSPNLHIPRPTWILHLLPPTCSNDQVGLYGVSGAAQRRYSPSGVPERLPTDPLTESCEQFRFPLEVVLNAPSSWLLLPLRWLCGLKSGWRWSSSVNSTAWNIGLLKPDASPGAPSVGFGRESRYVKD